MNKPTEKAYSELQNAFDFYNRELFDHQLPDCLITFQRGNSMAYFSSARFVNQHDHHTVDEIAMNPEFFAVVSPMEIMQTLVHEMTHCWQDHFGTPSRSCYHNTEWARKMKEIGLMPSSTGTFGGAQTGQKMADYAIPDGLFERATRKLFLTGFAVTWHDRYPSVKVTINKPPTVRDTATLEETWRNVFTQAANACISTQDGQSGDSENDFYSEVERLNEDQGIDLVRFAFTAPANTNASSYLVAKTDRSNRVKYTCPSCRSSVWGRPGLKLCCGEDHCRGCLYIAIDIDCDDAILSVDNTPAHTLAGDGQP